MVPTHVQQKGPGGASPSDASVCQNVLTFSATSKCFRIASMFPSSATAFIWPADVAASVDPEEKREEPSMSGTSGRATLSHAQDRQWNKFGVSDFKMFLWGTALVKSQLFSLELMLPNVTVNHFQRTPTSSQWLLKATLTYIIATSILRKEGPDRSSTPRPAFKDQSPMVFEEQNITNQIAHRVNHKFHDFFNNPVALILEFNGPPRMSKSTDQRRNWVSLGFFRDLREKSPYAYI